MNRRDRHKAARAARKARKGKTIEPLSPAAMKAESENAGTRGNSLFGGMRLMDRVDAAALHMKHVMQRLADFYDATAAHDLPKQRAAAAGALQAIKDQLRAEMLGELFEAASLHRLGPWPDAPIDTIDRHARRELHLFLDWWSEIVRLLSVDATRADLMRLEQRQRPKLFWLDGYADQRKPDVVEALDRSFLILLLYFVAARDQVHRRVLIEQLDVGLSFDAFEKWLPALAGPDEAPKEQRDLMRAAGKLAAKDGGLSLAQQARLSQRSRLVLARDDLPALAQLTDRERLQKLFERALRLPP